MREQNRQQELIVLQELQADMERKRREGEEMQQQRTDKLQKQKEAILDVIRNHGGPCQKPDDLISLLKKFERKTDKLKATKAQIDYEKIILGAMSPALRTSRISLIDLCVNFLNYKFGHVAEEMKTALQVACTPTNGSKRKRVAILVETYDTDSDSATDSDYPEDTPVAEEDEASQQLQEGDFSFNFSQQGQTVAVFYDRDFYVGQVLQVHNPDFADVTFITSTDNNNIFKWPQSEDIDQVAAKYVFDSDFEVVPKNRTWQIDSVRWGVLLACWNTFRKLFVDNFINKKKNK